MYAASEMRETGLLFSIVIQVFSMCKISYADFSCLASWHLNQSSCYYLAASPANWSSAYNDCTDMNAALASIENSEENVFINNLMAQHANGDDSWIGLTHSTPCTSSCTLIERQMGWFWLDGLQANYSNWDPSTSDPNEGTPCIRMKAQTGKWGDRDCQLQFIYVCKMQALNATVLSELSSVVSTAKEYTAASQVSSVKLTENDPIMTSSIPNDATPTVSEMAELLTTDILSSTSDASTASPIPHSTYSDGEVTEIASETRSKIDEYTTVSQISSAKLTEYDTIMTSSVTTHAEPTVSDMSDVYLSTDIPSSTSDAETAGLITDNTYSHNKGILQWEVWTGWTECSSSCEGGRRYNFILCQNKGDTNCTSRLSSARVSMWYSMLSLPCNTHSCPVDGAWNSWLQWSSCSSTCNTGTRWRSRHCYGPFNGGHSCQGQISQAEICNKGDCATELKKSRLFLDGDAFLDSDNRVSAKSIGCAWIVIIVLILFVFVLLDLVTLCIRLH